MLNPDDFVITRRRKKYKFAKFANSPLCFESDEWQPRAVDVVELGAGDGLFATELAARHPEQQVVAIDVKGDRLQKGAYQAEARGLTNVQFVRARAGQLPELLSAGSLDALWLTFSDPFPRKHSAGRRLTHPQYLKQYQALLAPDGRLHIKHDNPAFFEWSLEQFVAEQWHLEALSFDVYASELTGDMLLATTYEKRWLDEGRVTQYARLAPPAS